jgi:phage-related protein
MLTHYNTFVILFMFPDILNYSVVLYSPNGESSPVLDYIEELVSQNPKFAAKAILSLRKLPYKIFTNEDTKPFKFSNKKLWELRVNHGTNICRFFYIIERPNIIVVYGFTKKTQKTAKKDFIQAFLLLEEYLQTKKVKNFEL